jgi:hypothetical protein
LVQAVPVDMCGRTLRTEIPLHNASKMNATPEAM